MCVFLLAHIVQKSLEPKPYDVTRHAVSSGSEGTDSNYTLFIGYKQCTVMPGCALRSAAIGQLAAQLT